MSSTKGNPAKEKKDAYFEMWVRKAISDLTDGLMHVRENPTHPPGRVSFAEPVKKTVLSAEEVCSILKECKGSNLSVLKFGDLEIEFGPARPVRLKPTRQKDKNEDHPGRPDKTIAEMMAGSDEVDKSVRIKEAIEDEERELDELPITDPLEYERRLAAGELEDERTAEEA